MRVGLEDLERYRLQIYWKFGAEMRNTAIAAMPVIFELRIIDHDRRGRKIANVVGKT